MPLLVYSDSRVIKLRAGEAIPTKKGTIVKLPSDNYYIFDSIIWTYLHEDGVPKHIKLAFVLLDTV